MDKVTRTEMGKQDIEIELERVLRALDVRVPVQIAERVLLSVEVDVAA